MKIDPTARAVLEALKYRGLTLATAESCTGGLIGKLLTDVPGSSAVYLGGVISYTNGVKMGLLGVRPETLEAHTAVSGQTAGEMARGACSAVGAAVGLSVTGLAGPDGDGTGRPVGLVYIGCCVDGETQVRELHLKGDRKKIRIQAAHAALELILEQLEGSF